MLEQLTFGGEIVRLQTLEHSAHILAWIWAIGRRWRIRARWKKFEKQLEEAE